MVQSGAGMAQHKHKNSFIDDELPTFVEASVPAGASARAAGSPAPHTQHTEDTLITAPTFLSPSRRSLSRKRSGSLLSSNE